MRKNCNIYIVRHGETEWNERHIVQGQSDIPLNKKGIIQSEELGKKLKNISFAAVFSSDLIRAKRTAEIIILEKKLAVVTTKALRERLFGRFEGKHLSELKKALGRLMIVSKKKQEKLSLNDVENDEQIVARLIPFIKEVAVAYPGKNVLMVTHGGLLRAFLAHLGFKIPESSGVNPLKNTGYFVLESDGLEFLVKENNLF
jgi:2,3-bisphosphoglycerate-dependent phosphoglycerate mutase